MGTGVVLALQARLGNTWIEDIKIGIPDINLAVGASIPLPTQREPQAIVIRNTRGTVLVTHRCAIKGDAELQLGCIIRLISRTQAKRQEFS